MNYGTDSKPGSGCCTDAVYTLLIWNFMGIKNVSYKIILLFFVFQYLGIISVSGIDIWMVSSYENVFRDFLKRENSKSKYHLIMAKNEAESFQILLRSKDAFNIESVVFDDLISGNNNISSACISYNFLEYVFMNENTMHQNHKYLIRTGSGYYPDPLSNESRISVEPDQTQSVWITVKIPENCKPGIYNGVVGIYTNRGEYKANYTVEVCDVTIPDPHLSNFDFMHHQQIAGTWFYDAEKGNHPRDVVTQIYGWKRWTSEWWQLLDDMAEKMKQSRCNVLFVNTQQLLLDGETDMKEGKYHFDWSRFDEYIRFFLDRKVIKKMEGIHFGSTIGDVGKTYKSYILKKNEKGILCSANVDPMSEECNNFFEQFIPALYEHLKKKGWLDIWMQHIGDEAVSVLQHQQYAYYMKKMSGLAAEMHCGDPTFSFESALNAIAKGADIVVPIEELYQGNRCKFDSLKNKGINVYVYNCCGPGNEWLNRFIDKPVWQQRTLGWLCYKWGIPGWLHWGWNFWVDWFEDSLHTIDKEGFKGDHYSVYPDIKNNKIKNSIRQHAIRDMSEDYELLLILGKKNPGLASELVDKIAVNASGDYTSDVELMIQVRSQLIRAAAD